MGGFLFNKCLTVAGFLHVFSNASKDVYKVLTNWDTLYKQLKIIEPLVTNKDKLRKFVHTCVRPSPHSARAFNVTAPNLYDKRWGEVFKFCHWLRERVDIMRDTWDSRRYQAHGGTHWLFSLLGL